MNACSAETIPLFNALALSRLLTPGSGLICFRGGVVRALGMVTFRGVSFGKFVSAGSAEAYAFATLCVAVSAVARWVPGLWFEGVVPFATFFPAVLLAALVGGIGSGIFAAIAGGTIAWWAFLPPPMTFLPLKPGQVVSLIAYLITCMIIVWAAEHYRRLTKRLEDEEKFRELAVEELAHRLKNKVATIQSIVSLRLREDPQARDEIVNCLGALRATDDLIIAAQGKGARIGDILSTELRPYDGARISIDGPETLLSPKLALTMALLFHELATNAAKYGALSLSVGKISVRWSCSDSWLRLEWRESEGPPVTVPNHRGFGTRLFLRALEQFGGKVDATFAPTGLICKLSVPLSELTPSIVPSASHAPAVLAAETRPKIT
jgi:two-component sensor histidine kinase